MRAVPAPDWVIIRDGSTHEVLTTDGQWGTIDQAQWFSSVEEALEAALPAGTTGTARQQHPDAHE
jgi:hypothetical protein